MGRILVDARVPDGVELYLTELAGRVKDANVARVSKLRDEPGRNRERIVK